MNLKTTNYVLLILISILWGSQFLWNDIALRSTTPLFVATARCCIGALTLSVILFFLKEPFSSRTNKKQTLTLFFIAFFEATLPFFLIVWGQQRVSSCLTAIYIGTIPIFTALFVLLFAKNEHLHRGNVTSILLGFMGLLVLFAPDLLLEVEIKTDFLGQLAILGGACSFAFSLTMIKKLNSKMPVRTARNILGWASLQLIAISAILQPPSLTSFQTSTVIALLTLGIFCAGIVFALYVCLIQRAGATFASFTNYLVPSVGLAIGIIFLNESVLWNQVLALFLIIIALLANEKIKSKN
jgi:drug/metabolite transporter (DMT)-like permease